MSREPKSDDPAQSQRFRDLAKEVEADGTKSALEEAVKGLATQPKPTRKSDSKK